MNNAQYRQYKLDWLNQNFKRVPEGWVVYKAISTHKDYPSFCRIQPIEWVDPKPNTILKVKEIDKNPQIECGAGVNFGTKKFFEKGSWIQCKCFVYECLLKDKDVENTIVYNVYNVPLYPVTKARTTELTVLRKSRWQPKGWVKTKKEL